MRGSSRPSPLLVLPLVLPLLAAALWLGFDRLGGSSSGPVFDPAVQPPETLAAYRFAESHPAVFARVPCYCGCGASLGHTSLLDCFMRPAGGYESHASGCYVCLEEARDVERLLARGEDTITIRTWIDQEYRKYGPPTSTP